MQDLGVVSTKELKGLRYILLYVQVNIGNGTIIFNMLLPRSIAHSLLSPLSSLPSISSGTLPYTVTKRTIPRVTIGGTPVYWQCRVSLVNESHKQKTLIALHPFRRNISGVPEEWVAVSAEGISHGSCTSVDAIAATLPVFAWIPSKGTGYHTGEK